MELLELWIIFKEIFKDLVVYGFPTVAIIISILSYIDSRKAEKIQKRIIVLEEKLKQYDLEEKEKARAEETMACVEVRIVNISKSKYKIKFWNSGKAVAYKVDFEIPVEVEAVVFKDKVPYEFLEPGKSFEENIVVHMGTPRKFKVITKWEDIQGESHSKEQIVTI
ncbi:hypothetical protein P4H61_16680 [Paenibacillus peoriae]|uniref:hypothetical protein n=1 Tax=Paenibacillus peoriae TaxID=59893 RepID=UPI00026C6174|nr:hypothetical protein [Paenibacillus peoriae]MEC0183123.1 hypothetical protein [Paenibacillus peoriae]